MARRTIISVSISPRNDNAVIVAEALADHGISLTCGGGQILAWAAAYITRKPDEPMRIVDGLDLSEDEIDALFDAF